MKKIYLFLCAMLTGGMLMAQTTFPVTFQVDMATQTVSANGVHIAGNFQQAAGFPSNWSPNSTQMTKVGNTTVYAITVNLPAGSYEYKFINGNAWGSDESVPAACAVNGNRGVTVSGPTTIPVVCFGMCTACPTGPIPKYNVTFQVDLQNFCGTFDSVTIAGTLANWGAGVKMNASPTNPKLYTVTLNVDSGSHEYKFRTHSGGNTNWEGLPNRQITITSNQTVPVVCFNQTTPCTPKPADGPVTFRVDLSNGPVPADTVFLIGDFTTPAWQAGRVPLTPIGNGVYQVTIPNLCPAILYFKFVNGDVSNTANEESFPDPNDRNCVEPNGLGGFNRKYVRTGNNDVAQYKWNSCQTLNISVDEFTTQSFAIFPNPSNDVMTVRLGEKSYTLRLTDISGRLINEWNRATGDFNIYKNNLAAGVYMLQIIDATGKSITQKISFR
ncbi:MAG: T9SS type A sorting domain-containing protein [Thermaurantimonas sp.]|uniref:pullulanase X25 domain-containing protein n=1 Tax=Thermaurantimonas sp. TaxID=2681568 RepID=UPI00391C6E7C